MKHATYIGPPCDGTIKPGDTALVRPSEKPGVVLAQFDSFLVRRGGVPQHLGWHEYPAGHFEADPTEESA